MSLLDERFSGKFAGQSSPPLNGYREGVAPFNLVKEVKTHDQAQTRCSRQYGSGRCIYPYGCYGQSMNPHESEHQSGNITAESRTACPVPVSYLAVQGVLKRA